MSRRTSGVTLIELLISVAVGLIIITSAFGLTMSNRQLLAVDQERTEVNQNLRSALDIIGADVRVTGERLGSTGVPAMAVRNGNELVLRRSVHDDVMPACSDSTDYPTIYDHQLFLRKATKPELPRMLDGHRP